MTAPGDWADRSVAAMKKIAPIFDAMEEMINRQGPVDRVEAYIIALRAVEEVDMEKPTLEKFVAVLLADRTHQAVTP